MKKMMRTNPMSKALRSESVQAKKKTAAVSFKAMALVLAIAFAVSSLSAVLVSSLVGSHRRDRVSAAAATTRVLPEVNSANSVSNENYASKGKEIPIFNCTSSGVSDYDWTYSGSSDNAAINCSYDPDSNVYRFTAEGVHAGTENVELMYKQSDDKWNTVDLTLHVDKELNVTVE